MKDLWRFIKSSGIYFVGTVLTKLISFFLLPLYTSYINPTDYGTYNLYNSYIMFFCSVLFLDIWAGILRFMYEYTGEERKKPINCGAVIFAGSCTLYTIFLIAAVPILKLDYPIWLFLYGMLMNTQTLMGYIARGYGKNVLYTAAGLAGSFVTIIGNIVLLVNFHMDYSALFIASCIGYVVNIVIVFIGLKVPHLFSVKHVDKALLKELFFFSLPLCLNSVAYWFLTGYNSVIVTYKIGADANGYYAIASRFGSMITLFTTCFQMAWQELAYSKSAKEDNLGKFYSVAINNYIKTMGMGLVLLVPVIYIIYPIMVNESYGVGQELVPLYLMGTILSTISSFLGSTFGAIKKNNLLFRTMLAGSITNVVSVHILLPRIGLQASNIALVLGFFMLCVTRLVLLKKEMELKIDFKNIAMIFTAYILVYLVYAKGTIWMNVAAVLAGGLVAVYVFWDLIGLALQRLKK